MKGNDINVDNIPLVITVCCILYNIRELHGEGLGNLPSGTILATLDVNYSFIYQHSA